MTGSTICRTAKAAMPYPTSARKTRLRFSSAIRCRYTGAPRGRREDTTHRGEWLLVHWYAHSDGEAVRAISRVETDGDRLTAISPHPEQLPIFFAKSVQRMREFKGWTPAQIQTIRAPTLLLLGDRDIVRVEHAAQMQHLLPDARLAVLPATDHLAMTDRAKDVAAILDEFLLRGVNATRKTH